VCQGRAPTDRVVGVLRATLRAFQTGFSIKHLARCLSTLLACGLFGARILVAATGPEQDLPELAPEPAEQSAGEDPSAADLEKIAKMTANPIGAAWMLWTQNDYSELRGDLVPGGKRLNSTKFQPVMSFPIDVAGQDWNLSRAARPTSTGAASTPEHSAHLVAIETMTLVGFECFSQPQ